jgi:hypothetical protein
MMVCAGTHFGGVSSEAGGTVIFNEPPPTVFETLINVGKERLRFMNVATSTAVEDLGNWTFSSEF